MLSEPNYQLNIHSKLQGVILRAKTMQDKVTFDMHGQSLKTTVELCCSTSKMNSSLEHSIHSYSTLL